jgi:hypothetical protein
MSSGSKQVRKKAPVSQKRVAVVLASLVGTMTVSAGLLLALESGPGGNPSGLVAVGQISSVISKTDRPFISAAWQHVVIYQSGDMTGAAVNPNENLSRSGSAGPIPSRTGTFHFVVNSSASLRGSNDVDGTVEAGNAWRMQTLGAPHATWADPRFAPLGYYQRAIGVCMIGNIDRATYTSGQIDHLVILLKKLQDTTGIGADKIRFQWELQPYAAYATPAQKQFAASLRQRLN